MKTLLTTVAIFLSTSAYAADDEGARAEAAPKPTNSCQQSCQPVMGRYVCSKHCWQYKGGPGSVLVQVITTWTAGPAPKLPVKASAAN